LHEGVQAGGASKSQDYVAVVAPLCSKPLRLATAQLPENFPLERIGVGPIPAAAHRRRPRGSNTPYSSGMEMLPSAKQRPLLCDTKKVRPEASIPPPASGRAQRASTLAKTQSGLKKPASPRSGSPRPHHRHHCFPPKYKLMFVLVRVKPRRVSHRAPSCRIAAEPNFAQTAFYEGRFWSRARPALATRL